MRKIVLHPFLFAVYPVLLLHALNIDRLVVSETLRLYLFTLLGSGILVLIFWLLTRNWYRSGLVASLIIVLFSSFGHVYNNLSDKHVLGFSIGQADVLAAVWVVGLILLGWWLFRKLRNPNGLNYILNVTSLALIVFPLLQIGLYCYSHIKTEPPVQNGSYPWGSSLSQLTSRYPDIYYIILDEYGRADVLKELMSFDNATFIQGLESRGFYVASNSHSNYAITTLSIASSLNLDYLDKGLGLRKGKLANDGTPVYQSIQNNNASNYLKQRGYKFVSFASGYSFSELHKSDLYIEPENNINNFELIYLNNTAMIFGRLSINAWQTRKVNLNNFERLGDLPRIAPQNPKFIFVHIAAAHIPFVFDHAGKPIAAWVFPESPNITNETRSYRDVYIEQIRFINSRLMDTIDKILSNSEPPPIIIIQSDHGPQSKFSWNSVENTCMKERMSILNAYYLPGFPMDQLYPSITPVNTFRYIFNYYFGADLEKLDDRSYFSLWNKSYKFIDVTDRLESCK